MKLSALSTFFMIFLPKKTYIAVVNSISLCNLNGSYAQKTAIYTCKCYSLNPNTSIHKGGRGQGKRGGGSHYLVERS